MIGFVMSGLAALQMIASVALIARWGLALTAPDAAPGTVVTVIHTTPRRVTASCIVSAPPHGRGGRQPALAKVPP